MAQGLISNVELSTKRNWFSPGFQSRLALIGSIEPFGLPYVVDGFARILSAALEVEPLIDLKGADSGKYYTGTDAPHLEDSLAEITGNSVLSSTNDEPASEREPFSFSVKTRFNAFRGEGSIVHTLKHDRSGALPDVVTLENIGRVFPLEILKVGIGFDLFIPRRYPMLGVSPVVSETVRITADQGSFSLSIDADFLPQRGALPLQRFGLFDKFAVVLGRVFEFDLQAKYAG